MRWEHRGICRTRPTRSVRPCTSPSSTTSPHFSFGALLNFSVLEEWRDHRARISRGTATATRRCRDTPRLDHPPKGKTRPGTAARRKRVHDSPETELALRTDSCRPHQRPRSARTGTTRTGQARMDDVIGVLPRPRPRNRSHPESGNRNLLSASDRSSQLPAHS
jgi:hypothetical protein